MKNLESTEKQNGKKKCIRNPTGLLTPVDNSECIVYTCTLCFELWHLLTVITLVPILQKNKLRLGEVWGLPQLTGSVTPDKPACSTTGLSQTQIEGWWSLKIIQENYKRTTVNALCLYDLSHSPGEQHPRAQTLPSALHKVVLDTVPHPLPLSPFLETFLERASCAL